MKKLFLFLLLLISILSVQAFAQTNTNDLFSISLFIAFIGGLASLFSPCAVAIFPAFFAYAFEGKKELLRNTVLFFIGLIIPLIILGSAAVSIGKFFILYRGLVIRIAGIIIILFGIMSLTGKGFSFRILKNQPTKPNIFIFGLLFGTGFVPCAGPILGTILTLATTAPTLYYGILLMIVYSLGIVAPLLAISYYFDKHKLYKSKLFTKTFRFGNYEMHWTHFISGILFVFLGSLFVFYGGTSIFSSIIGIEFFFNIQNKILELEKLSLISDPLLTVILILIVLYIVYKWSRWSKK